MKTGKVMFPPSPIFSHSTKSGQNKSNEDRYRIRKGFVARKG